MVGDGESGVFQNTAQVLGAGSFVSRRVDGVEPAPRRIQTRVARRSEAVDDEVRSAMPDTRGERVEPKRPSGRFAYDLVQEPDELGRRKAEVWLG